MFCRTASQKLAASLLPLKKWLQIIILYIADITNALGDFRDLSLLNLATCLTDHVFLSSSDMRPCGVFVFLSTAQVEVLWNPFGP